MEPTKDYPFDVFDRFHNAIGDVEDFDPYVDMPFERNHAYLFSGENFCVVGLLIATVNGYAILKRVFVVSINEPLNRALNGELAQMLAERVARYRGSAAVSLSHVQMIYPFRHELPTPPGPPAVEVPA